MATVGILGKRGYARLLKDARRILEAGKGEAQRAVGQVLARTYWELGQRILQEELTEKAGYGTGVVEELARDLGLSRSVMFRVVAFAQSYPEGPPALGWTQCVELLSVKSVEARQWYEARALTEGWSKRELRKSIEARTFLQERSERAAARGAATLPRPTDTTHVYAVEVTRVIDGDTVVVEIDLGFDVIRRQKMRLADVDTPPLDTEAGREAARFVRERLAAAEVTAVKTVRKEDPHGRYVAHLFYSVTAATVDEAFRQGRHLNGELVERGLGAAV
ncbi:MAG: DUF1016 N-terminal domain-containing protein [Myxococcales bacterium]|jgi:endonuclease YncB( thermonuclease family)